MSNLQFASVHAEVRYLEIPKAACSSIKAALLAADGIDCQGKGMHRHSHWQEIPEDFRPQCVFTFVRHPLSRLESSYREKCRTGKAGIIDPNCPIPRNAPFHEWVDWVTSQDPQRCNPHWRPQSVLLDQQGIKPTFVGRLESLKEDWAKLRRERSALPDLPHINPSQPSDRIDWDGISYERASTFYSADFTRFAYTSDAYARRPGLVDWKSLQGFFDDEEGAEMQQLARGRDVLEIGIWKARSTVAMAATARHIVAVDHFRGDAFAGPANTCHAAWTNLCETGARDRITMIVGAYSQLCELAIDLQRFDLIHYDADHTYESTVDALNLISSRAALHATLAIHDYDHNPNHAGVRRAVDEFIARTGKRLRAVRRLAILEPSFSCPSGK